MSPGECKNKEFDDYPSPKEKDKDEGMYWNNFSYVGCSKVNYEIKINYKIVMDSEIIIV